MVHVESGTFTMGSDDSDAKPDETPHTVTLTKDYWIGKYEVTQEQYEAVTRNPSHNEEGAKYPVRGVSWNDAQEFCKKLNGELASQLPTGYEFRLPTEAEWEYAARGGKKSKGYKYSGSNDIDSVAWYRDNSGHTTHPVGSKSPNELGICDMSGNVCEWCLDCIGSYLSGAAENPLCTCTMDSDRVFRGGCWCVRASNCRVSVRCCIDPSGNYFFLGFRIVLAPKVLLSADKVFLPDSVRALRKSMLAPKVLLSADKVFLLEIGITLDMVFVEAGTFIMGNVDNDAFSNETPHTVTLTEDYWIGKYEVTQEQYEAVTGMNPSNFKKGAKYPVEQVSWNDAQTFCKKLNAALSSQLPVGYEFRLPTEAEWEYAARGGKKSKGYKYSGSDDIGSVAWYNCNCENTTHPVGGKLPNELGICDMTGNVYEWCLDRYNGYPSGAVEDPICTTGPYRIVRGGGWTSGACSVSCRGACVPAGPGNDLGFRLALAPCMQVIRSSVKKNSAE